MRIGAMEYRLEIKPDLEVWGCIEGDLIQLSKLESPGDWMTLFHEALHALSEMYGLGLSERTVRVLEQGVVGLLKDNPEFLTGLRLTGGSVGSSRGPSDDAG